MKKQTTSANTSHPYLIQSTSDEVCGVASPLARIRNFNETPEPDRAPDPKCDYSLGTMAQGLYEVDSQLKLLRRDISRLKEKLRIFLPDHMFDLSDMECCGESTEGYFAAGNVNSPVLQVLADLANTAQNLRDSVSELTANIVN